MTSGRHLDWLIQVKEELDQSLELVEEVTIITLIPHHQVPDLVKQPEWSQFPSMDQVTNMDPNSHVLRNLS